MAREYQLGLRRAARARRIFVVEEPVFIPDGASMDVEYPAENLAIARPCLPYFLADHCVTQQQRALLDAWMESSCMHPAIIWYHLPVALTYSAHLRARLTVFDCVDGITESALRPREFARLEYALLERADIVFAESDRSHGTLADVHPVVRRAARGGALPALDDIANALLEHVAQDGAATPLSSRLETGSLLRWFRTESQTEHSQPHA